jgi:hypothetical protein
MWYFRGEITGGSGVVTGLAGLELATPSLHCAGGERSRISA